MKILSALCLTFAMAASAQGLDHSHALWGQVLAKHLKKDGQQTWFDYQGVKKSPEGLGQYLKELSSVSSAAYQKFSRDQKLAFLINAYNAFTVDLIVKNYPLESIKDIDGPGFFGTPWDISFIPLLGKKMTLDEIEHETIRKDFQEPRIHFAVNCASIGCPSLYPRPFQAANLEKQLEAATTNFLANKSKNFYRPEDKELNLSKIFDWYGGDFKKGGGVRAFVAPRMAPLGPGTVAELKKADVSWTDYDWKLNEKKKEK